MMVDELAPPWDPLVISPCRPLEVAHGACCERTIQFSRTEGARTLACRTGARKVSLKPPSRQAFVSNFAPRRHIAGELAGAEDNARAIRPDRRADWLERAKSAPSLGGTLSGMESRTEKHLRRLEPHPAVGRRRVLAALTLSTSYLLRRRHRIPSALSKGLIRVPCAPHFANESRLRARSQADSPAPLFRS
jgi:hypothetical protein